MCRPCHPRGIIDTAPLACVSGYNPVAPTCGPPISGFGSWTGNTAAGPNNTSPQTCGFSTSPENAFTYTATGDGPICIDTIGSAFDTVLYTLADCGDPGSEQSCNDDFSGLQSGFTTEACAGDTFTIIVDGYGSSTGDYTLNVSPGPCL